MFREYEINRFELRQSPESNVTCRGECEGADLGDETGDLEVER